MPNVWTEDNDSRVATLFNNYAGEKVNATLPRYIDKQPEPDKNDPIMQSLTRDAENYGFNVEIGPARGGGATGYPNAHRLGVYFYVDHHKDVRIQKLELTPCPECPCAPSTP